MAWKTSAIIDQPARLQMPTCAEQVAAGVRSYPLDDSVLCSALACCVAGHHLFPTTVKRESCKAHKQLCTGEFPTTLVSVVLVAASGLSSFFVGHTYPTSTPSTHVP